MIEIPDLSPNEVVMSDIKYHKGAFEYYLAEIKKYGGFQQAIPLLFHNGLLHPLDKNHIIFLARVLRMRIQGIILEREEDFEFLVKTDDYYCISTHALQQLKGEIPDIIWEAAKQLENQVFFNITGNIYLKIHDEIKKILGIRQVYWGEEIGLAERDFEKSNNLPKGELEKALWKITGVAHIKDKENREVWYDSQLLHNAWNHAKESGGIEDYGFLRNSEATEDASREEAINSQIKLLNEAGVGVDRDNLRFEKPSIKLLEFIRSKIGANSSAPKKAYLSASLF